MIKCLSTRFSASAGSLFDLDPPYFGLLVTRLKRKTENPERQHVSDPAENDPLESMLFLFHVAFFKKVPVKAQESHVALSKSDLNARKNLSVQYWQQCWWISSFDPVSRQRWNVLLLSPWFKYTNMPLWLHGHRAYYKIKIGLPILWISTSILVTCFNVPYKKTSWKLYIFLPLHDFLGY